MFLKYVCFAGHQKLYCVSFAPQICLGAHIPVQPDKVILTMPLFFILMWQ